MRRRSFRDNAISLAIGCVIGIAIALSAQTSIVHDCIEQISAKIELIGISEDISRMEFPESNADHGNTLEEVIYGLKDEEYEYIAIFYGPHKLFEATNFSSVSTHCAYTYPSTIKSSFIMIHNHPDLECSFSYNDLYDLACKNDVIESIVVTSNTKYSLMAPNGWPSSDELVEYIDDRIGTHFGTGDFLDYECALAMEQEGYLILSGPDENYGISIFFTSKLVSEYAEHFGLIYTVEPLD